MTLDEAREILGGAAWAHETPLVTLFDEIVELHNDQFVDPGTGKEHPGKVTRAFADYKRAHVSSGRVVQLLISLRQQNGMPRTQTTQLYELRKVDKAGTGS